MHEADDTALRLAVAETKIEALHAMVQELQRARNSWQAQAERLALMAPTVIAALGPVATREAAAPALAAAPEPPRRSMVRLAEDGLIALIARGSQPCSCAPDAVPERATAT